MNEDDVELASQVHYGFLPRAFSHEALDVAVSVLPHDKLGGDYCSVFPLDEHRVVTCICDAVGHGVAAALFAARVNTYVLTHAHGCLHPCALIESLNQFLCENLPSTRMFATFYSVIFDTARGEITFAGAGHPPALFLEHASGEVTPLPSATLMLGVKHPLAVACSVDRRRVCAGDRVLLYTDGLIESRDADGVELGVDGLGHLLAAHADLAGDAFNDRLLDHARARGALEDDVLLMTITIS